VGHKAPVGFQTRKENHCTYCSFIFVTVLTELLRSLYLVDRLYECQANGKYHSKLKPFKGRRFFTYEDEANLRLQQCVYVFCVDLRTNSDYFPKQR